VLLATGGIELHNERYRTGVFTLWRHIHHVTRAFVAANFVER
jgi:hypothetical protein